MSEKKTKLSLEAPDPITGFQAFALDQVDSTGPAEGMEVPASDMPSPPEAFGLPQAFWGWLASDAGLRNDFEQMIESRVAARMDERFEELKAEVQLRAEAEGIRKGMEVGRAALVESIASLNAACAQVLKDKVRLLQAHEKVWIQSFSHLLRRFLVPRAKLATEEIQQWLTESIGAFDTSGKIVVRATSSDYGNILAALSGVQELRWEVKEDPTLPPGELHCQCEDGGVLFSSSQEMNKLDSWIQRFVAREEV